MSGTVRIETKRLVLRQHVIEDADYLYTHFGTDENMFRYSGWNPYATPEMARETVQHYIESYVDDFFFGCTGAVWADALYAGRWAASFPVLPAASFPVLKFVFSSMVILPFCLLFGFVFLFQNTPHAPLGIIVFLCQLPRVFAVIFPADGTADVFF